MARNKIKTFITADTKGLERGLARAQKSLAGFGRAAAGLIGGGLAIGGIREIDQIATSAVAAADEIGKAAKTAGIGAGTFQEYAHAAVLAGNSQKEFADAVGRFNRRLGEGRRGNKAYADAFAEMGVSIKDTNEQALEKAFNHLAGIKDEAQRTSAATKVFGDDARRMALVVADGADALARQRKEARDLGVVLRVDLVKGAEAAQDKLSIMERQLKTKLQTAVLENVDGLIQFKTLMNDISRFAVDFATKVGGAADALDRFFDRLPGTNIREEASVDDLLVRRERLAGKLDAALARVGKSAKGFDSIFPGIRKQSAINFREWQDEAKRLALALAELDREIAKRRGGQSGAPAVSAGDGGSGGGAVDANAFAGGKIPGAPSLKSDALFEQTEKAQDRIAQIIDQNASPLEKMAAQLKEIDDLKAFAETPQQVDALSEAADRLSERMQALKDATNAWKQAGQAAAQGIGDALANAIVYGDKLGASLKRLAQQLASKLLSQFLTKVISNGFGGGGGFLSGLFGGGKASGGPVSAGKVYLVGERGPELFAPGASGSIIPNGGGGRGFGGSFGGGGVLNVNVSGARGNQEIQQMVESGVRRGVAAYDSKLPLRFHQIAADPRLVG